MILPDRLLDRIYDLAMPAEDFFKIQGTDLVQIKRIITSRFVEAIDTVMLEEMEEVVGDD